MAKVMFWEKPRCVGNARQRALIQRSGHDLEVRDILTEPWTETQLRPFFGDRPVREWFNPSAPRVKSGEIDPAGLTEAEALALMLAEPLLIRRPLMQVEDRREAGFDPDVVAAWIGLDPEAPTVTDACPRPSAETDPCR